MNSFFYKINDDQYQFYYNDKDGENLFHMSYPKIDIIKNNIILDIGGNIGSSAVYFTQLYPNSIIHVFEPDDISFNTLVLNTRPFKNIKCYNFGLFDENKLVDLLRCPFGSSGNSIYLRPELAYEKTKIQLRKTEEVIKELDLSNANILKVDTEGCEVPILKNIFGIGMIFDVVYVEYHSDEDRFEIEKIMYPKYKLIHAKVMCKNIGELTYINEKINGYECSSMKLPNQGKNND